MLDREVLKELLGRWRRADIGPWEVVQEVEKIEGKLVAELGQLPELEEDDPAGIALAALELLSNAHLQMILPEDIPSILSFLDTEAGHEPEAWREFNDYWARIDFREREDRYQRAYFEQALGDARRHDGRAE